MRAFLAISIVLAASSAHAQQLRAIHLPSGEPADAGDTLEELLLVRVGVWRAGRTIRDEERPALARTMDAAYARFVSRSPNARLVAIEGAHFVLAEHTADVQRELRAFLREHGGRAHTSGTAQKQPARYACWSLKSHGGKPSRSVRSE
jgi:hypothetical protein